MELGVLLRTAIEKKAVDLQALITFLVFEKKVLTLKDDSIELNLYFLERHKQRMNKELKSYKKKINMGYDPTVYKVTEKYKIHYIYAHHMQQAKSIAYKNMIKPESIEVADMNTLMDYQDKKVTLKSIVEGRQPSLLGSFEWSKLYF